MLNDYLRVGKLKKLMCSKYLIFKYPKYLFGLIAHSEIYINFYFQNICVIVDIIINDDLSV